MFKKHLPYGIIIVLIALVFFSAFKDRSDRQAVATSEISVIEPSMGNEWIAGNAYRIEWADAPRQAVPGSYDIELWGAPCKESPCQSNLNVYQIASGYSAYSMRYAPPQDIPKGQYKVVVCREGRTVCGHSPYFGIK